jgi:hypothetical protein
MYRLVIIFTLLTATLPVRSQIELIKGAADAVSSGELLGNGCSDGCFNDCCVGFFTDFTGWVVDGLAQHHRQIVDNPDYPGAVSFEVMPHGGYNGDNLVNFIPRVRGTWGVLSTDFRMNFLAQPDDAYQTYDWQILILSTYPEKHLNIRVGSGIFWDTYTGHSYNEHFAALEMNVHDQFFTATAEGRMAFDYYAGISVFSEAALRGNFRVVKSNHMAGYVTLGAEFQNYYDAVNLVIFTGGMTFNIHQ